MSKERIEDPCSECPLDGNATVPHGSRKAKYLIVGKGASREIVSQRRNMPSGSKTLISRHLKAAGFKANEFVFTNSVRCAYDQTRWRATDKKLIESCCREHLLRLIERMGPECIIPLGADAAKSVMGRAVKISKIAGVPSDNDEHGCTVLPMMDPAIVHIRPEHENVFASDCRALATLVDHDHDIQEVEDDAVGEYSIITDLQFLIDRKPKVLAFDLETVGARREDITKSIVTMQFCTQEGEAFLLPWDHPEHTLPTPTKNRVRRQLRKLLQNPNTDVIGQNLKYDALWLLSRLGIRFRMAHDTLMMAAINDENLVRKDLDTLTKLYAPDLAGYSDLFNARYDKSRMDLVPIKKIVKYGCGDTDACMRVYNYLRPLIERDSMLWTNYTKVAMPALNAFIGVEEDGVLVDCGALEVFEVELSAHVEELRQDLLSQIPRAVKRAHVKKGVKLSRAAFLIDVLFKHPKGFRLTPKVYTKTTENLDPEFRVPSVSAKDHLPLFFDECPFTETLAHYVKMNRILGTGVRRFRENYIRSGKIFPSYGLAHAVTGRSNSRNPNIQNIIARGPLAKAYNRIFVSPRRHYIVACDLSQAECLRFDTRVLTYGRGYVKITDITTDDLLWDGCAWVRHGGVIFKGYKDVISYQGISGTPDHIVYLESGGSTTLLDAYTEGKKIAIGERGGECVRFMASDRQADPAREKQASTSMVQLSRLRGGEIGTEVISRTEEICGMSQVLVGGEESVLRHPEPDSRTAAKGAVQWHNHTYKRLTVRQPTYVKKVLQGEGHTESVQVVRGFCPIHGRESADAGLHRARDRQDRQRWALRAGEHTTIHKRAECTEPQCECDDTLQGRGYVGEQVLQGVRGAAISQFRSYANQERANSRSDIASCDVSSTGSNHYTGKVAVYDIVNCGPNNRFTAEGLIVSNCRIVADMANEPTMIRIYNEGGDIHTATAQSVMGINDHQWAALTKADKKRYRTNAKAVNFGFLYGMWWRKFMMYAKIQYGIEVSEAEARTWRERYFQTYSGIAPWHDAVKSFAHEHGYVRSYDGRVRHLPMIHSSDEGVVREAERQAVNSSVQALASNYGLMSMSRMQQEVDPKYMRVFKFVHDALYAYVPEEYVEWAAKTMKWYMQTNPLEEWFGRTMKVPFVSDAMFGPTGGDMIEMEGLDLDQPFDFDTAIEGAEADYVLPPQKIPPKRGRIITPPHLRTGVS